MTNKLSSEIVILGSGASGASLAEELAEKGKEVLILEKGSIMPRIGSERAALKYYDKFGKLKSQEGVILYRTIMAGGTTVVSCGNGVRSLENEFKKMGVNIGNELKEAEESLRVKPMAEHLMGEGTKAIWQAASALGYEFRPMPKYINYDNCLSCGNCILGCAPRAKWSALKCVEKSQEHGARLITNFKLESIETKDNKAVGIRGTVGGIKTAINAHKIILSCGALETPRILQGLGIRAGKNLFCDLFTVVYGISKKNGLTNEPSMAIVNDEFHAEEGFIMSPFLDSFLSLAFLNPAYYKLSLRRERLLGIMIKIKDDMKGGVEKQGNISKIITSNDEKKMNSGNEKARKILIKAGVDPKTIIITKPRGAHPGGTAAMGNIVDASHETAIKNLYVCDASVLPEAPGLPPILTLVALSKRFASIL